MTVPVPGSLTYPYDEDGVTTVFAYPVRFLEPQELMVTREVDGVPTVLAYNVDYTVSGAGTPNGGSITRTAVTNGGKIIITRQTAWKQIVDLEDKARNPAEAVELQMDRLTMAGQDNARRIGTVEGQAAAIDDAVRRSEDAAERSESAEGGSEAAQQAAEAAQAAAEQAAGSVQWPVSYGVEQSLAMAQRLQAQANIGPVKFDTVANLLADTILDYSAASGRVALAAGKIVEAQGFRYEVAASGATDHHIETAGGVKLYVLKKDGCWYAEAFGVVTGDWATDAPGEIVDCTVPFQAALNALFHRDVLILPVGTIYTGDVRISFNPRTSIPTSITLRGEGPFVPQTIIQFLPGATLGFILPAVAYSFHNIQFRGTGNVSGSALFTSTRSDGYADQDWDFSNCSFTETFNVGKMNGRGLTVDHCLFGVIYDDAWILDYPDPAIAYPPGYWGTIAGGFRGFTVRNSRFHGISGYLFNVTANNAINARGFTITGNQWDTPLRVIKGYANDLTFTGNNAYVSNNTQLGTAFDMLGFTAMTITGNTVSNSTTDRLSGDKPFIRSIGTFSGLTVTGNTFRRRDVPILTAELSGGMAAYGVTIANNTYDDCFVTAPYLVRITGTGNGVLGAKIDEAIRGVPPNWLAVYGDINWQAPSIRVIMNTPTAIQHNLPNHRPRDSEPRSDAYTGDGGTSKEIFVGYSPRAVRVYKKDGSLVAAKVQTSLSPLPSNITFTATGFSVSGTANSAGVIYYWEAG